MKKCIYCGKEIQDKAIKCRYCKKFFDSEKNINVEYENKIKNNEKIELNNERINLNDEKIKLNTNRLKDIIQDQLNNRILIIIVFFVLIIFGYFLYNFSIKDMLTEKEKINIMKSVVRINYFPEGDDEDFYIGSGIIFSKDGLILTNNHVIADDFEGTSKGQIQICIPDIIGTQPSCLYTAKVLVRNPYLDIAIIKINDYSTKNYVKLFNDKGINTHDFGKTIQVYGYPDIGGETLTITTGIISGFDQINNIKTDAEINGGNSGGGAFLGSKYIGIPSSTLDAYDRYGKIGFIISDIQIKNWFNTILGNGKKDDFTGGDFSSFNLNLGNSNTVNGATHNHVINQQDCIDRYGEFSYYDEYFNLCYCYYGYDWGGYNNEECIIIENGSGDDICHTTFGYNSYYTGEIEDGQYMCDCIEGYEWGGYNDEECVYVGENYLE